MNCKVTIYGSNDSGAVHSDGELRFCGSGFELKYFIGEDRCSLVAAGGTVTQSRRGEVDMDITFAKGKNTVCMLLSGELTGSIPVRTEALVIRKSEAGVDVYIDYFLGGAKINLRLSAAIYPKENI